MLLSIHYLRGLASLFVVMYHYKSTLNNIYNQKDLGDILFNGAFFGVDLFFMISGFVIVLSTRKDSNLVSFFAKRAFKIYPVYISLLLTWVILHINNTPSIDEIFRSLFFVHLDYAKSAPWFGYSVINTAWTLTYEILFYMLFSLGLVISHKYRTLMSSLIIISFFVGINYYYNSDISFNVYSSVGNENTSGIIKLLSSPFMLEFVYGMIVCEIYILSQSKNNKSNKSNLKSIFISAGLIIFALCFFKGNIMHGPLSIGIPCLLLISAFVAYEKSCKLKEIKPLMILGNISYPLYLIHLLVSGYMYEIKDTFPFYGELHGFTRLCFLLFLSIFLAYIVHVTIEKPASSLARIVINKTSLKKPSSI